MDYVAIAKFRSSVSAADRDAALMRRAAWKYPDDVQVIAEYWPISSTATVVTIVSTDSPAAMLEVELEWSDVFDIDVYPAISADEGLKIGPEVFGRLARMQQP